MGLDSVGGEARPKAAFSSDRGDQPGAAAPFAQATAPRTREVGAVRTINLLHHGFPEILRKLSLVERLDTAFQGRPEAPLRQRIDLPDGRELLVMPAVLGNYAGVKTLTVIPANAGTLLPVISGLFELFDFSTGRPLATFDGSELTAVRTAAVSAFASSKLSRTDASSLTMLGAGHLAPYLAAGHAEVRPIRDIRFWARDRRKAEAAAARLSLMRPDVRVSVSEDLEAAVRAADIVSTATRSIEPLVRGEWLRAGMHLDLVGGYRPEMREVDDEAIRRGSLFVDTLVGATSEAGDIIQPLQSGTLEISDIRGDLADIAAATGIAPGITIFKSVGTAVSDLVTAIAAWEHAAGEIR